jgi:flavin-dependent dehydrogenase
LLLASLLAPRCTVAVLEARALGETKKFWATTPRRLALHDLSDCTLATCDRLTLGSFLGARAEAQGHVVVVNEQRLLERLVDRCRKAGVVLFDHTRVSAIRWCHGSVRIDATASQLTTPLLIDCTGGSSSIAATFRLHELTGFFTIYAEHRTRLMIDPRTVVAAQISLLGHPPVFFELMPTGPDSAFCIAFTATKRVRPFDELRATIEDQLARKTFVEASDESAITNSARGVIPIGRLKRRLPGIASFGEAAMLQPPLLGTAFNEVLEHAKTVADQVIDAIERRKTRSFRPSYPIVKRLNDRVQWWFVERLIGASAEEIDYLIRISARLTPETLFTLYSNELTFRQLVSTAGAVAAASWLESRGVHL